MPTESVNRSVEALARDATEELRDLIDRVLDSGDEQHVETLQVRVGAERHRLAAPSRTSWSAKSSCETRQCAASTALLSRGSPPDPAALVPSRPAPRADKPELRRQILEATAER
jgi:hypothetical protein